MKGFSSHEGAVYREEGTEKNSDQPISRREFLRTVIGGGAAAMILSEINDARLWAAEVKEGMSWQEGIRALRSAVFKLDAMEEGAVFLKYKNGKNLWMAPQDGDQKGFKMEAKNYSEIAKKLRNNELDGIIQAHTHPLAGVLEEIHELTGKNLTQYTSEEKMRSGRAPLCSIPPSYHDVMSQMHIPATTGNNTEEVPPEMLQQAVADPRGIWLWQREINPNSIFRVERKRATDIAKTFAAKIKNSFEGLSDQELREFLALKDQRNEPVGRFLNPTKSRDVFRMSAVVVICLSLEEYEFSSDDIEGLSSFRKILSSMDIETQTLYRTYKDTLKMREMRYNRFFDIKNNFIEQSCRRPLTQEDYDELKKVYYDLEGISLKFTPYKDFGL